MTGPTSRGGGSLFTEPVLVVKPKVKLMFAEYALFNQHDQQIGVVREVRQSAAKKFVRFVPAIDQFLTHKWQVVDANGQVALTLTRPTKIMKPRIIVESGDGREVGQVIQQQNVLGRFRFSLESGERQIGSLKVNWGARYFNVQDTSGREVAQITNTTRMFATTGGYVVQIHEKLAQPLHSLVVASVLGIDIALKKAAAAAAAPYVPSP